MSPHCPRPRHSPPIHLPSPADSSPWARQHLPPAPGSINLLPPPPPAPAISSRCHCHRHCRHCHRCHCHCRRHGCSPRGHSASLCRSRCGAGGSFQLEKPQWEHWDLTQHLPACEQETPESRGACRAGSRCCVPFPFWAQEAPSVPPVWRGAVPGAAVRRRHSRGRHGRVPARAAAVPVAPHPGRAAAAGTGTPHYGEPGTTRCPPVPTVPLGVQSPRCLRCPWVCSAPGAPGRAALPVRQLQLPVPP